MKKNQETPVVIKPFNPASHEQMEKVVAAVDAFRKKGFNIAEAVEKTKLNMHYSTYYNYRNKLGQTTKKMRTAKIKKLAKPEMIEAMPMLPHTIEYIQAGAPKKPEQLLMVLGSSDALLDFINKLRGEV